MKVLKSAKTYFVAALIYTLLVAALLCMPTTDLPSAPSIPGLDKLVHLLLFGCLFIAWMLYIHYKGSIGVKKIMVFIWVVVYGLLLEIAQLLFTTDRHFDWWDLLADAVGALIAYWCWAWLVRAFLSKKAFRITK